MTVVLAIDPSLSGTGLAIWRTGQPLVLDTIREGPFSYAAIPAWDKPYRHARISDRIMGYVPSGSDYSGSPYRGAECVAVIEDILKPSQEAARGQSTLDLARLRGAIEVDLFRARISFTRVHAATLKAFARAGKSSKSDMVTAARDHLPADYVVHNDNEADAYWLLAMAMQQYGHPIVPKTPRRTTFGAKPEWAPFTFTEDQR